MQKEKIELGACPYLYPMPTVLVGAHIDGKPVFLTASFVGIVQQTPPLLSVSLANNHLTNKGIKENQCFSINIPNTKMLAVTDFIGMNSGDTIDKAALFNIFYGKLKAAPLIQETPLNLECKLVKTIDLNGKSEIFIGEITQTYSTKEYIRKGYPYLKKLDPILFSINSNSYYNVGRRIGWAWKTGLKINPSKIRKK